MAARGSKHYVGNRRTQATPFFEHHYGLGKQNMFEKLCTLYSQKFNNPTGRILNGGVEQD